MQNLWSVAPGEEMNTKQIQRVVFAEGESPTHGSSWMLASEVDAVFKPGVAYMPVPRCGGCASWDTSRLYYGGYNCLHLTIVTSADFGCVDWVKK